MNLLAIGLGRESNSGRLGRAATTLGTNVARHELESISGLPITPLFWPEVLIESFMGTIYVTLCTCLRFGL